MKTIPPNTENASGDPWRQLAVQAAHDARSPLTAICTYAECLAWLPPQDLTTRERYARAVVCEAQRLGRMLADYLVVLGQCPPENAVTLEPVALVRDVLAGLRETLELRGQSLGPVRGQDCPALHWPAGRLRQLLQAAFDCLLTRTSDGQSLGVELAAEYSECLAITLRVEGGAVLRPAVPTLHQQACEHLLAGEGGWLRELLPPLAGLKLTLPLTAASARGDTLPRPERIAS